MNYIFWGFFFIFFNFNIHFGTSTINLIPIFVGYMLLIKGIDTLKHFSPRFKKIRGFCFGMAILTGTIFVIALLGISGRFNSLFILIRLIAFTIGLYPQYHILRGIKDIGQKEAVSLKKDTLIWLWLIVAAGNILGYIALYLGTVTQLNIVLWRLLSLTALGIMLIGGAIFLSYLYQERQNLKSTVLQDRSSTQNDHN